MKKTRKQTIMENSLSIEDINKELRSYKTGKQKAKFLREMGQLNLPYDIKWENLAQCHEGSKPWPSYKYAKKDKNEKDENILSDGGTEVVTTMDDKPLTHAELEALI
tara:strand:- start:26 stop:346 length:321 start_codon:yes stop_codon:yes gene_type:complete